MMKKEMLEFLDKSHLPIFYEERELIREFIETFFSNYHTEGLKMEWIDREIEFPDDEKILCFGDGEIFICTLVESKWGHHYRKSDYLEKDYEKLPDWTHWMPLPLDPNMEEYEKNIKLRELYFKEYLTISLEESNNRIINGFMNGILKNEMIFTKHDQRFENE